MDRNEDPNIHRQPGNNFLDIRILVDVQQKLGRNAKKNIEERKIIYSLFYF